MAAARSDSQSPAPGMLDTRSRRIPATSMIDFTGLMMISFSPTSTVTLDFGLMPSFLRAAAGMVICPLAETRTVVISLASHALYNNPLINPEFADQDIGDKRRSVDTWRLLNTCRQSGNRGKGKAFPIPHQPAIRNPSDCGMGWTSAESTSIAATGRNRSMAL